MAMLLIGLILLQIQSDNDNTLKERLSAYQWQKRVVMVIASTAEQQHFMEQKNRLASKKAEVQDRDLEILNLVLDKVTNTDKIFLRKSFDIQDQKFCIILIGKDGGEKRRSYEPLQAEDLFQTIDAMPMRKREMSRKNKQ